MITILICGFLIVGTILYSVLVLSGQGLTAANWFMLGALTTAGVYSMLVGEVVVGSFATLPLVATLLCNRILKSESNHKKPI